MTLDGLGKLLTELIGSRIAEATIASMDTHQRWPLSVLLKTDRGSVHVVISEGHVSVTTPSCSGQALSPSASEARAVVASMATGT